MPETPENKTPLVADSSPVLCSPKSLMPERDEIWAKHDGLTPALAAEMLAFAGSLEMERDKLREALIDLVMWSLTFAEEWLDDVEDWSTEERYFKNGDFRRVAQSCDAAKLLLEETAP